MAKVYINIVHVLFWSWVGANVTLPFILLVLMHEKAEACWHFWYILCDNVKTSRLKKVRIVGWVRRNVARPHTCATSIA